MRQVIQSNRTGELKVEQVPVPPPQPGRLLVQVTHSLVSTGTESMKVQTARRSLVGKARSRPDLVRQVINTYRKEGFQNTYRKVMNRLDSPAPLGYSASGIVVDVAPDVDRFRVGDRVACAGAGYANHSEYISVPMNLCAAVPDDVELDAAAFTTVGAIALQGVRQANVSVGENVLVLGLGLVGQMTVQILRAAGCRVFGMDLDPRRNDLGRSLGAQTTTPADPAMQSDVARFTGGLGFDAVLICAATRASEAIRMAADLARDRGRLIVVGIIGMELEHKTFYDKELTLTMSRSYGPGRYDPMYEESGVDYPPEYVRWTEGRNMEAVLDLLAQKKVIVEPLITHRFAFDDAAKAYDLIAGPEASSALGIVFEYAGKAERHDAIRLTRAAAMAARPFRLGVIGAGNFAKTMLLPHLKNDQRVSFEGIATATSVNASDTARRLGFRLSTTDAAQVLEDPAITAVLVATRHDQHAALTDLAIRAGKAVHVEKPLALDELELQRVTDAYRDAASPFVMVGFNRRFAPLITEMRRLLGTATPRTMLYRVNAGFVPADHWYHSPTEGGGRLIGEGCHFIDLLGFLADSRPSRVYASRMDNAGTYHDDNVCVNIEFENGSAGSVVYVAAGDTSLSKVRLEVFCNGAMAVIDDFRELTFARGGKRKVIRGKQDKGHEAEMRAFVDAVTSGAPSPMPFETLVDSTLATLAAYRSVQERRPIDVPALFTRP